MTGAFIINSNQWENTPKNPQKRKTFPSNFYQFNYRIEIGGQLDIAYQVRLNINSN